MENLEAQSHRYAVYARSRTDLDHERSITDQINACIAAAAEINPQLALAENGVFTDVCEPGTALHGLPGLAGLIEMSGQKPRSFDYVIITDLHRFRGRIADGLRTIDTLKEHGVEVRFVSLNLSSNDPNFRVIMAVSAMVDEEYVRTLGAKVWVV